jgi:threonine dehydrogenase-like Zn-dependent dehydrogenase
LGPTRWRDRSRRRSLEGRIEPGRVFDRVGSIEDVPDGYRAMNDREVLKFPIKL